MQTCHTATAARSSSSRVVGLPASPAAPAAAAAPSPAAAAPSPAAAAPASPPPASPPPAALPEGDGLEGGVDIIDGLEIVAEEAPSHARQSFALVDAHASTVAELEETIASQAATIAATRPSPRRDHRPLKRQLRDYEQPAAPARPAVSAGGAGRFLPAKPGKQPRDDAARRPPPPPSLPKARLGERGGRTASAHTPLFLRPRRTVEGARAAMMMVVDGLYGASHGGARCPPDLYAGWSVVLTRMGTEPLRWVDGGGRVWRTRNDATRAMGLVRDLGPPKCRATDQHWAKMPFGDRRGLLREGAPEPEVVDLASDDERAAPRKKPRRE
ncbi:SWIB/MDM2 domain-containing protein [Aureococcus anophagefferens]|nr:SWIB/MDM2 domain-containing protein [Aureococcus anophagefferens]